jgi:serine O-acetyltransferase
LLINVPKLNSTPSESLPLAPELCLSSAVSVKTNYLNGDFKAATGKNSSTVKIIVFALLNPGFRAVCFYRFQQFLFNHNWTLLAHFIFQINHSINGCELLPGCEIGHRLVIRHPTGIVLGQGAQIGSDCFLQHGVTLGVAHIGSNPTNEYPVIGNGVEIGSYAVIVGRVNVGESATIGALSVVTKDVPPFSVVVGAPAQVIRFKKI